MSAGSGPRVSLKDIAARAGVTFQTVSAVLTDKPGARVSPAKRAEIRAIAAACGYRPNAGARAIRAGRFDTLVLVQTWRGHPLDHLLRGLLDATGRHRQHLLVEHVDDGALEESGALPRLLSEHHADGLLINRTANIPDHLPRDLRRLGVPAIWINRDAPLDCAAPDDAGGAALATERLLALGHRRIAWAPVHTSDHHSEAVRFAAHGAVLRSAGCAVDRLQPRAHPWMDGAEWDALAARWRTDPRRPTAVVCSGADEALTARLALERAGLRVPQDVSLIGFAPEPIAAGGHPVATVVLPDRTMGDAAVEMLLAAIASPELEQPSRRLPCTLREGCTLARAGG